MKAPHEATAGDDTPLASSRDRRRPRRSLVFAAGLPALLALPAFFPLPDPAPEGAPTGPAVTDIAVATEAGATLDPELAPARAADRSPTDSFETAFAPFEVRVADEPVGYEVMAVTVLPGATVEVTIPGPAATRGYELRYSAGEVVGATAEGWMWRVPTEPGIYALRIGSLESGSAVRVNAIALHPSEHIADGKLHGYRIGRYAERPLRGNPVYLPPSGFAEVPADAEDILVSPHFTIGQFLCKQPGEPRFLALSLPLIRKLEAVLAKANERGIITPTFHVMSGFRTPWYNASIGNKTIYSRHLWGDAADIFVDVDGNSDMDDLNGDGRSDHRDARLLADIVEEVEASGEHGVLAGGIGLYRRAPHRGPFVHVDARGHAARW